MTVYNGPTTIANTEAALSLLGIATKRGRYNAPMMVCPHCGGLSPVLSLRATGDARCWRCARRDQQRTHLKGGTE